MADDELQFLNSADDHKTLAQVVGYYHDTLTKNDAARKYLMDQRHGPGVTGPARRSRPQ